MKVIDLIKRYYDEYKKEYQSKVERKNVVDKELKDTEEDLREKGYYYGYNPFGRYSGSSCNYFGDDFDWRKLVTEQEELIKDIPLLKEKMIKLNKIINNNEQLISLKKDDLEQFSYNKIILEVGTNGIGQNNSNIDGKIKGGMSGSSFLGFGSIDGSVDGFIKGNSNSKYEDYILIKYKYNLDYDIDEILFDINEYIK